ncbi:sulfur carrier protein ThiS [Fictibacillus nanhaiensis]|uniref:sulfur carrier protein ThiS n=1 Tax=Fictibacillus nanhaiensis TaxID=742169 RepID=UPI002042585B|nr:sulfur carrier protein ThiS [Fictibacillus nanhaiensis]MCM3731712.1 sulfur carrier protein ThiS [Fictibacillus nanhaiensis]
MKLQINGEQVEIPEKIQTLKDLLIHLQLQDQVIIAEINKEIISNHKQGETEIKKHDNIELVRFVGGG